MIVQSGLRKTFEVTWGDTGLFAQASIYDDSTGTPVHVADVALSELVPGTYVGGFVPLASKSYAVVKRVFTDGTYTTVNTDYPASSEAFQSVDFSAGGGGGGSGLEPNTITMVVDEEPIYMIVDAEDLT